MRYRHKSRQDHIQHTVTNWIFRVCDRFFRYTTARRRRSVSPIRGFLGAMSKKSIYKIIFMSQGQVYEIYARHIGHGALFGFVEVEQLVFGERSSVVVDPSEEKIKSEFEGVTRTYLPMHSVLRIDEVEKEGTGKITKIEGNVTQFPTPVYTPNTPSSK